MTSPKSVLQNAEIAYYSNIILNFSGYSKKYAYEINILIKRILLGTLSYYLGIFSKSILKLRKLRHISIRTLEEGVLGLRQGTIK